MSQWVRIAAKAELPNINEAKEFTCGEKIVCVANVAGTFSALDNVCIHRGGPLGQGVVLDGKIICPWHGWAYDPATGAVGNNPAAKVAVYPLQVEGEDVKIEF